MSIFTLMARDAGMEETKFKSALSYAQRMVAEELEKHRSEKHRLLAIEIEEESIRRRSAVAALAVQCADDMAKYEHEFHSTMEMRKIEIAKLEAKAEALKEMEGNDARCYKEILANKDSYIKSLYDIITKLVDKPNQTTVSYIDRNLHQ